jgi:hypothetical protein
MNSPIVQISPRLLQPRIAELGHVKIGGRGDKKQAGTRIWYVPKKFDHFVVTRRDRAKDGSENYVPDTAIMTAVGATPRELDVHLMWDEPERNFQYFLAAYDGKRLRCRGDGEHAHDREQGDIPCTCPLLKQHQGEYAGPERPKDVSCKPFGRLSVILDAGETFGGYHVFRTTSWETISAIAGALQLFRGEFGGLRGLPLKLVAFPTTDTYEQNGQTKTSRSLKVTLVLRANQEAAYRLAAVAREWRSQFLLPAGETTELAERHQQDLEQAEVRQAEAIAGEFHPKDEPGEYFEVEDEEAHPLESVCRRALEIAGVEVIRVNRAFVEYAGRITELAAEIEVKRPAAWKQAMDEAAAEAEQESEAKAAAGVPAETSPAPVAEAPLDLFGDAAA